MYALSQCVLCVCARVCFSGLEDASSSSPKATYAVQTKWKERTSRWSTSSLVRPDRTTTLEA